MGHRVSAYLSDEVFDAWKASGIPLGEAVRRGLAGPPAVVRRPPARRRPAAPLGPIAAMMADPKPGPVARMFLPAPEAGDCPHPKARVIKGLCGACGTHVG